MISVVIPALNEEKEIACCLRSVIDDAGGTPVEIIVVDGGSHDATLRVAGRVLSGFPGQKLISAGKGRGRQMNAGAAAASGEILLFLHADSRILPGALERIRQACRNERVDAGCFLHRFDGRHPFLRCISRLHNFRFRCTNIIYGDQGLFVRRALFERLGAFRQDRVMEDVEFSERLLALTTPQCLELPLLTSSRKFESIGVYRAFVQVLRLIIGYELGHHNPASHAFFQDVR